MHYFDYPEDHLMNYVGRILFCHELASKEKLLKYIDESEEHILPIYFNGEQKDEVLDAKSKLQEKSPEGYLFFRYLIMLNLYQIENNGKELSASQIVNFSTYILDGQKFMGFNINELIDDKLNRRRHQIYYHVQNGKIVRFPNFIIRDINQSMRKVKKDNMADNPFWQCIVSNEKFDLIDPNNPKLQELKAIVVAALDDGKEVMHGYRQIIKNNDKYQIQFPLNSSGYQGPIDISLEHILSRNMELTVN